MKKFRLRLIVNGVILEEVLGYIYKELQGLNLKLVLYKNTKNAISPKLNVKNNLNSKI